MKQQMMQWMQKIMLTCLDFSEWVEKSHWTQVPWIRRVQIKIHKKLCPLCESYEDRQREIESLFVAALDRKRTKISSQDLETLKKRILAHVQDAPSKDSEPKD